MSEKAERYARMYAPIFVNEYKNEIQGKIDFLTNPRGPITLEDYAHPDATPFRIQRKFKEKLDNLLTKKNQYNKKLLLLNADERRAVKDAYLQLVTLIDKEEAKVLNTEMKHARVVTADMTLTPDKTVETKRNPPIDASHQREIAASVRDPPPYTPNGGKRKTRRRRKLKKRKTMKKKRLRRKKTMKKRKSRKRRKTKKRRSKRR